MPQCQSVVHVAVIFLVIALWQCLALKLINGAYVHIPFCRRKCHYCSFAVQAIGNNVVVHNERSLKYTNLLNRELILTKNAIQEAEHELGQKIVDLDTIYIGGGTPSLMNDAGKSRLLFPCCH